MNDHVSNEMVNMVHLFAEDRRLRLVCDRGAAATYGEGDSIRNDGLEDDSISGESPTYRSGLSPLVASDICAGSEESS